MITLRILFLHGLESGPQGRKIAWLRAAGFEVVAPQLDTNAVIRSLAGGVAPLPEATYADALAAASEAIRETSPDLLIGSSFGGGLAVEILHRGLWTGPVVLLAPAGRKLFGHERLPVGHGRAVVLHGRQDEVVPVEDSLALAVGSPGEVQLWLVDDDHRLAATVENGVLGRVVRAAVE